MFLYLYYRKIFAEYLIEIRIKTAYALHIKMSSNLFLTDYGKYKHKRQSRREKVKGVRRRLDERAGTGEIDFSRLVHRPIARVSKVTY